MSDISKIFSTQSISKTNVNWANDVMRTNVMWNLGYFGNGIKIGVVDTGIDLSHPMMKDKVICGKNFSSDGTPIDDINDYNYHGTAVSSLICGEYMNYKAYGIAPKSNLIIAKSMDAQGHGTLQTITDGINYCVEQGADIINCSVGCIGTSSNLENAVKNAVSKGVCVVVSSGNDGSNDINGEIREISYPAGYDDSICVGAIGMDYSVAGFSNSNEFVDCVAPGVDILCAYPSNRYALISGTSFASPLISGTLAILKEKFRVDFGRNPSEAELYGQLMKYMREISGVNNQMQGNGYP